MGERGLDAHEEQQLRAQRDDAVDTVRELAPLREAAIRLFKADVRSRDPRGITELVSAWDHFALVVGEHVEEYGEDPL